MKNLLNAIFIAILLAAFSCKSPSNNTVMDDTTQVMITYNNPPAEGFDIEGSHPIAVLLADQVMNAMGGRAKWDSTNVIHWNFFGKRTLLWDKQNNWVRVDIPEKETVMVLNMNDDSGKVWVSDTLITDEAEVTEQLQNAKNIWVNDSYWLVMPFKLKDSGVTLSYLREDTSMTGEESDVLGLTFDKVGITPHNAYEIWVSIDSRLVVQWAFFENATDEESAFVLPWTDYKEYDGILLSGERGQNDITEIAVFDSVPAGAFENPKAIEF